MLAKKLRESIKKPHSHLRKGLPWVKNSEPKVTTGNTRNYVQYQSPKRMGVPASQKIPTIADRAWQCLAKYAKRASARSNFPRPELWIQDREVGARRAEISVPESTL